MNKKDILKQIDEFVKEDNVGIPIIRYDKKWRWWNHKDSDKTCPLLRFGFDVEYKSGTLIFIPDAVNKFGEPGNSNRNGEG